MRLVITRALQRIEAENERRLAEMPVYERDQMLEASKTMRGTIRYLWKQGRRG